MTSGTYYTAQVCRNGHVITDALEEGAALGSAFCGTCGAPTISACEKCHANIRGYYHVPGVLSGLSDYSAPNYCYKCGNVFPWTAERIKAAEELAGEIEALNADERQQLKESITQLTVDTPRTQLASVRYQKFIKKAGVVIGPALNQIMVQVATEGAKKLLGL